MTTRTRPPETNVPTAGDTPAPDTHGRRVVGFVLVALLAATVALLVLASDHQLSAPPAGLNDPGPFVRVGLPVARVVFDLTAALAVGFTLLGGWLLGPTTKSARRKTSAGRTDETIDGPRAALLRRATVAALAWTIASAAVVVLTGADLAGVSVGQPGFGTALQSFVTQVDLGRELVAATIGAALVLVVLLVARRPVALVTASLLSLLAMMPIALTGHSSSAIDHMNSMDSLALHLTGVTLWVGGLGAVVWSARGLGSALPVVVQRYSRLAGWCFALVALSGVVNAELRLGWFDVAALGTPYGRLVLFKTAALVVLGAFGAAHRRRSIPALVDSGGARGFARLATVEVAVMAATVGLAVGLARSAPPRDPTITAAQSLLGYDLPPAITPWRYLVHGHIDVLWLLVSAAAAASYVVGVRRLHRRGDRWPLHRTIAWTAGCLVLFWLTSGGPATYGHTTFSWHMLQHMLLMTLVPLLFVLGAPITLALRALRSRDDGSLGVREVLLRCVHAPALGLLAHPISAAVLFVVSLVLFYETRLFDLAMFTHAGHVLMTVHFVAVGYLFINALVGLDPIGGRPAYPLRMVVLLATVAFHAFFGVVLMSSHGLIGADWWHALGYWDDAALLADQQTGGAIAWGAGDVPSLLIGLVLLVRWFGDDTREARRQDRQDDRDGGARLKAYNERLARLARRATTGDDR